MTHLKYHDAIDNRKWQTSVGKGGKSDVGKFDDSLAEGGLKEMANKGMTHNHAGIKGSSNNIEEVFLIFHTGTHGIIITAKNTKNIFMTLILRRRSTILVISLVFLTA